MTTPVQLETALRDFIKACKEHWIHNCVECKYKELCNRIELWECDDPKDIEIRER